MKIRLFIPTYNESPVIKETLAALRDAFRAFPDIDWHLTVVDNASSDDTKEQVESLRDPQIDVIEIHEKGKGLAVRTGFLTAGESAGVIGFTDADLSVPPNEIIAAMRRVANDEADVVIGSRFHKDSVMPGREWWRVGSSGIFNVLAKIIVGTRVSDTQCPLKVMNEKGAHLMRLTEERTWFFDLEFLALCERRHIRVLEVPVTWDEHRYPDRRSKLSTTRDGMRAVIAMFRIRGRLSQQLAELDK